MDIMLFTHGPTAQSASISSWLACLMPWEPRESRWKSYDHVLSRPYAPSKSGRNRSSRGVAEGRLSDGAGTQERGAGQKRVFVRSPIKQPFALYVPSRVPSPRSTFQCVLASWRGVPRAWARAAVRRTRWPAAQGRQPSRLSRRPPARRRCRAGASAGCRRCLSRGVSSNIQLWSAERRTRLWVARGGWIPSLLRSPCCKGAPR